MNIFRSFAVCFSMYSIIPMPKVEWNKENMKYSFCFFPAIGLVIGLAVLGIHELFTKLSFGGIFIGVAIVILPIIISGAIHLDGFIDTCDAIFSYGDKEKKLKILEDPNAGAFGVIGCVSYFILMLGGYHQILEDGKFLIIVPSIFIASRSIGIIALLTIRKSKEKGLGASFSAASYKIVNLVANFIWLIASLLLVFIFAKYICFAIIIALGLFFIIFKLAIVDQFGGMSGDLTGFIITSIELLLVLTIAVGGRLIC